MDVPDSEDGIAKDAKFGVGTGFRVCILLLTGFWPASAPRIAVELGLSENYVRRLLVKLKGAGVLVATSMPNTKIGVHQTVYAVAGYEFGAKLINRPPWLPKKEEI